MWNLLKIAILKCHNIHELNTTLYTLPIANIPIHIIIPTALTTNTCKVGNELHNRKWDTPRHGQRSNYRLLLIGRYNLKNYNMQIKLVKKVVDLWGYNMYWHPSSCVMIIYSCIKFVSMSKKVVFLNRYTHPMMDQSCT